MVTEQAFPAPPFALGGNRIVAVPSQFYSTGEDYLQVKSACSVAGVTLAIRARIVGPTGSVNAEGWSHTPNSDRSVKSDVFDLGVGALLNLSVFASSGTLLIGQCYVMVNLVRGSGAAGVIVATLLAGVVTTTQALGWPGSPIVSSTSVEPAIRDITGTQPGPGLAIVETCPTGARWELIELGAVFVTSNAVGNREVFFEVDYGVTAALQIVSPVIQAPSNSYRYSLAQNLPLASAVVANNLSLPLPQRHFLVAGDRFLLISTLTAGNDQWSAPLYQVREWLEVA